uniref:FHA domain-containing protein n=1 Tax=Bracon brevicornis TaxID=1563983 RepID=A0A6V7J4G3_9HYME
MADNTDKSDLEEVKNTPSSLQDDTPADNGGKGAEKKEGGTLEAFKKPTLIIGPRRGKISSLRSLPVKKNESTTSSTGNEDNGNDSNQEIQPEKVQSIPDKKPPPLPYREPSWSGIPSSNQYKVEILKSGVILDTLDLYKQSFHVIGRLPVCDISLQHPTISRYHAVFQYRETGDDKNGPGFYLYDLESTHGTFWNNCRIRPKTYVKLKGGHIIRFGCSQRRFIIHTPPEDEEEESEHTVTELKEMRRLELLEREKMERLREEEEAELERLKKEKEESEGIDWGMGEDADEETDLTENPYAQSNNEELFLDDPKKTLRGWFEREGHDLQYQTEDKGPGQFLCWVDLPIENGRTVRAETVVKGKKKEAVVQCALEACRVLDRYGLLRQANHEGRKRKSRNWEEEDYYDSDEDNYLDRTGAVERKREQRMRNAGKLETKVENYNSLIEKQQEVQEKISKIETTLENHRKAKSAQDDESGEDALDAFMSHLNTALLNKSDIIKLKSQLVSLRKEEEQLRKLVDIARPANLPALKSNISECEPEPKKVEEKKSTEIPTPKPQSSKEANTVDEDKIVQSNTRYGLIKATDVQTERENDKKAEEISNKESPMEIAEDNHDTKDNTNSDDSVSKQKKRNQRKIQKKAEKAAKEVGKEYPDMYSEDYSMWVPPDDQSGDGKTNLNDKYGY